VLADRQFGAAFRFGSPTLVCLFRAARSVRQRAFGKHTPDSGHICWNAELPQLSGRPAKARLCGIERSRRGLPLSFDCEHDSAQITAPHAAATISGSGRTTC
jgi:hypothetical protein